MEKYSEIVMKAMRGMGGVSINDSTQDDELLKMGKESVFLNFLRWEIGPSTGMILAALEDIMGMGLDEIQQKLERLDKLEKEEKDRFFELSKANIQDVLEQRFAERISGFSEEQMDQLQNKLVILLREKFTSCNLNDTIDYMIFPCLDGVISEVIESKETLKSEKE